MKIGITERGDAGLDFAWYNKLKQNNVDGAILITKNVNSAFRDMVLNLYNNNFQKIIVHATCTGWGESPIEPNVPNYKTQLHNLKELIDNGFPIENCVIRVDPIIPTVPGLQVVDDVLLYSFKIGLLPKARVRISVLDEYRHVKQRLNDMGYASFYPNDCFQATPLQMNMIKDVLNKYQIPFYTCAEPKLFDNNGLFIQSGCISDIDLKLMGLEIPNDIILNPQNRNGCKCLSCKTELLSNKLRCAHQCAYCYWKD